MGCHPRADWPQGSRTVSGGLLWEDLCGLWNHTLDDVAVRIKRLSQWGHVPWWSDRERFFGVFTRVFRSVKKNSRTFFGLLCAVQFVIGTCGFCLSKRERMQGVYLTSSATACCFAFWVVFLYKGSPVETRQHRVPLSPWQMQHLFSVCKIICIGKWKCRFVGSELQRLTCNSCPQPCNLT